MTNKTVTEQATNKKYLKYLKFRQKKYYWIVRRVEATLERLNSQGYTDIRVKYAGTPHIVDLSVDGCAEDAITVKYTFGEIAQSPVDAFSIAEIEELLAFARAELRRAEGAEKSLTRN